MRNVCGLNVYINNVFVCIGKEIGEKIQFKIGILTRDLDSLRSKLCQGECRREAMESTRVYWMFSWCVLESHFRRYSVNLFAIKILSGCRSIKDAEWRLFDINSISPN